ncbi:MAG: hypothetical protein M3R55_14950 [Acidobacteriota bacterium]|nr:hypothetical protein [Acidobacteriota bacterium]
MNDHDLRLLVRDSIAKHLGSRETSGSRGPAGPTVHTSHGVYTLSREDADGPCIIEPSVPCTHCNYCKSHGH